MGKYFSLVLGMMIILTTTLKAQTVALWLFDEPIGLYPSHVMDDQSANDYPIVLGPGGKLVKGKFGNALSTQPYEKVDLPEGEARFGLSPAPKAEDRTVEPLSWMNANFCALMTSGENHLRKEVGFVNSTEIKCCNIDGVFFFFFQCVGFGIDRNDALSEVLGDIFHLTANSEFVG